MSGLIHKALSLAMDIGWFVCAGFLGWLIRAGLEDGLSKTGDVVPYLVISGLVAAPVFFAFRLHQGSHRFFSLRDSIRVIFAISLAIAFSISISFGMFRLEGIQRSLPVLHWATAVAGIFLIRLSVIATAYIKERRHAPSDGGDHPGNKAHPILIIGFTPSTEIQLRLLDAIGKGKFFAVGILEENIRYHGMRMRQTKVIGSPAELPKIIAQLAVHGLQVRKVVLATDMTALSSQTRQLINRMVKTGEISFFDFNSHLNAALVSLEESTVPPRPPGHGTDCIPVPAAVLARVERAVGSYRKRKRGFDLVFAALLGIVTLPLIAVAIPLIWISMGTPVYFWQERPGRNSKPFRLYKLRTLTHAVGPAGEILDDKQRQTGIGRLLRRTRVDEIPQLVNVLRGEMSFVGPRPLLPVDLPADMPDWAELRQMVRPGITGWAQINGGHAVSKTDKLVLDAWYLTQMSTLTDARIVWRTVKVVIGGEKLDYENIARAYRDLGLEPALTNHQKNETSAHGEEKK